MNVIHACKANGIKELIVASSSEVYQTAEIIPTPEDVALCVPDPLNPRFCYAGAKIITELLALNAAADSLEKVVIFRPHNVYGPDMGYSHVIPEITDRMNALDCNEQPAEFQIQGTGLETRSFIFIDDFIEGFFYVFRKWAKQGHF